MVLSTLSPRDPLKSSVDLIVSSIYSNNKTALRANAKPTAAAKKTLVVTLGLIGVFGNWAGSITVK